jgi:hypothetical protein
LYNFKKVYSCLYVKLPKFFFIYRCEHKYSTSIMAGHMNSNINIITLIFAIVCVVLLLVVIGGMARPDLVRSLPAQLLRRDGSAVTAVAAANCCTNQQHCCACPHHVKNKQNTSVEGAAKNGAKNCGEKVEEQLPMLDMPQNGCHPAAPPDDEGSGRGRKEGQ